MSLCGWSDEIGKKLKIDPIPTKYAQFNKNLDYYTTLYVLKNKINAIDFKKQKNKAWGYLIT